MTSIFEIIWKAHGTNDLVNSDTKARVTDMKSTLKIEIQCWCQ